MPGLPIRPIRVSDSVWLLSPGGLGVGNPGISAAQPLLQTRAHPDEGILLGTKKEGTRDTHDCAKVFPLSQTQKLYDPFI